MSAREIAATPSASDGELTARRGPIESSIAVGAVALWLIANGLMLAESERSTLLAFVAVSTIASLAVAALGVLIERRVRTGVHYLASEMNNIGMDGAADLHHPDSVLDAFEPKMERTPASLPSSSLSGRSQVPDIVSRLGASKLDSELMFGQMALKLQLRFAEAKAADERARTARQNAERARGLLFAGVSHDLKSPLNAILGFADLMTLEQPLTEGQRESLDLILSRGRELVALVETILDSARVEAGQLALAPRDSNIAPILRDARLKALELVHAQKDIEVFVDEDLPEVSADAAHLTRAFALVIAHALKSHSRASNAELGVPVEERPSGQPTPGRGVPMLNAAHTGSPTPGRGVAAFRQTPSRGIAALDSVAIRARNTGGELRIDVEHRATGPTLQALEEVYFTKKRGRGLRLGLRLARTILELHGGRIEVTEKDNGRPTVSCFLPLAQRAQRM